MRREGCISNVLTNLYEMFFSAFIRNGSPQIKLSSGGDKNVSHVWTYGQFREVLGHLSITREGEGEGESIYWYIDFLKKNIDFGKGRKLILNKLEFQVMGTFQSLKIFLIHKNIFPGHSVAILNFSENEIKFAIELKMIKDKTI